MHADRNIVESAKLLFYLMVLFFLCALNKKQLTVQL